MANLREMLAALVQDVIQALGYPGIGLVMLAENVFPPIPSELVMPFSGFLVARGDLSFVGVWLAGVIGSVAGAVVLYYLGMWAGDPLVRRFVRRYGRWLTLSEKDYDRALGMFERHGAAVVFFGRLIPMVRSLISIPAGANRMPMPVFLLYTTLGSAIWTGMLTYAGVALGDNWEQVLEIVDQYQSISIIVFAVVITLAVLWLLVRRSRRAVESPTD